MKDIVIKQLLSKEELIKGLGCFLQFYQRNHQSKFHGQTPQKSLGIEKSLSGL